MKHVTYVVNTKTKRHYRYDKPFATVYLLENERLVSADQDGWINWDGGECPLPDDQRCEVKYRSCDDIPSHIETAGSLRWSHRDWPADIVAYRPVSSPMEVSVSGLQWPGSLQDQHQTSGIEQALNDPDHPYHDLADVLEQAFQQASGGKGKERHANDLPFTEQKMQTICRGQGHSGGLIYQICKKAQEAERLERDAALRELLGVIVYAGGAFIYRKGE